MIKDCIVECYVTIKLPDDEEDTCFITCNGTADIYQEKYGEDADGNRGVWETFYEDVEPNIEDLEYELYELYPDMVGYTYDCEYEDSI